MSKEVDQRSLKQFLVENKTGKEKGSAKWLEREKIELLLFRKMHRPS
jgi:hypothetical protein